MNTDEHRYTKELQLFAVLSVFICVHLWLIFKDAVPC